jgi:hypothetical protein
MKKTLKTAILFNVPWLGAGCEPFCIPFGMFITGLAGLSFQ